MLTSSDSAISPAGRRALLALWLSLALHAAFIGMVRVTPRTIEAVDTVLEARLEDPVPAPDRPDRPTPVRPVAPSSDKPEARGAQTALPSPLPQSRSQTRPESEAEPEAVAIAAAAPPAPARPNNPEPKTAETVVALDVPLAADRHYYAAKELDVQPRPLHRIFPAYPPEYETQGLTGYAVLEMRLEADGQVSELNVAEVSPAGYQAFGREAVNAFHGVGFTPARRQGQPVRALFRVRVKFEIAE